MTGMQKGNTMGNRPEGRVTKLEKVANISRSGCIIYFENVERGTVVNADGDEHEVFVGDDFTIGSSRIDIDEVNAHLIDGDY